MTGKPKNLSQAIDDLENDSQAATAGIQDRLKSEFHKIEETLASLRPHLEDLTGKLGDEAKKAKSKVEGKVQENPWATVGIVAILAFVLGFFFASKIKRD